MLTKFQDYLRLNPRIAKLVYIVKNQYARFRGRLCSLPVPVGGQAQGVALCLRFRDEGRYIEEWIEYYLAAGIRHLFLYNNNSSDSSQRVVLPYVERGMITLIEWPQIPASPAAEEDCIRHAIGRFEWVGFIDADEFVVIADGRSIPEFLAEFKSSPAVGLHWYFFGSNGHQNRPSMPVIEAYTRRRATPDVHVKVFVRPEAVTQCHNSHSWFYRRGRIAVDERGAPIWGSRSLARHASRAWINHYYTKSAEDYLEKSRQKTTLDISGMKNPSRTIARMEHHLTDNNQVECLSALQYYNARRAATAAEG